MGCKFNAGRWEQDRLDYILEKRMQWFMPKHLSAERRIAQDAYAQISKIQARDLELSRLAVITSQPLRHVRTATSELIKSALELWKSNFAVIFTFH
jgi:hypothetical protein